ncbi:MAG: sugar phosphate isomerase/epimerase family protein [bacterium]
MDKNVIACRDTHLREVDAPDVWSAMKKIGITGVEVWVEFDRTCANLFYPDKKYSLQSTESIADLSKDLKENGLTITSFCMGNRFEERPEEELTWVAEVVQASKELDVKAIRIDFIPRKMERDDYLKFAISIGKRLVERVQGTDIRYGIENHGSITNDPEFLDPLFEGVGSDALGLTLDTGNFYWYGHPLNSLYDIYKKYASRTWHTHCKSIHYPEDKRDIQRERGWEYGNYCCPIYDGDIDFAKVAAILKAVDYTGDFCIENESLGRFAKEERERILRKEAAFLHQLV